MCGAQDVRVLGSLKTSAFVPGGANGVLSKLNSPSRTLYAESLLLHRALRCKLRVSSSCERNLHHNCRGNYGCAVHRPEIKLFLNVWIQSVDLMLLGVKKLYLCIVFVLNGIL